MERALRGDGELSRFLRENGWNGDWIPLERDIPVAPPPATSRQKKAKPSEPRRDAEPANQQRRRRGAARLDPSERRKLQALVSGGTPTGALGVALGEQSFPRRRALLGGTWAAASTSISPREQCRVEAGVPAGGAGVPAGGLPPIGHGASPRPSQPPAKVLRLAQAQPAAQPIGQPSSPEMPGGGGGSGQLLQTPSPPDCGRPVHDSGSPRPCRVSADGGARGAARRGSFATRVDAAEAQLLALLGGSGKGGAAACAGGGTAHADSPAAAAVAAYSSPSPPTAAAGSRTVGRRRTTDDDAPVHTTPKRRGDLGSDGAEPREDSEKHLTLDQRISPRAASGAPPPLSRRRASTLTAAAPAPPEAGRAIDHRSSEERVLARRASDGGVGAAGLAALVSNHAPESPRSQVRRTSTLSTKKFTGELHHDRRRTVGDAAHHQQARC